jgi:dethiobiotin synthetase
MPHRTLFITGTDTGVGKTTLAALLVCRLRARGIDARAVKPVCSGGRADARLLARVQGGNAALDEINPWHFRAPLAPLLSARLENRRVTRSALRRFVRVQQERCDLLIVEGAGGILSPLGEDVDARDLIARLEALPVVVCPNRLGAINQALMALAALPPRARRKARLVLVEQRKPDQAARGNVVLLRELLGGRRVPLLPWLSQVGAPRLSLRRAAVRAAVDAILGEAI